MVDVFFILKDLWRTKNLQEWINNRFKKEGYTLIKEGFPVPLNFFRSIETKNGIRFFLDDQIHSVFEVFEDYRYDDIQPDDVVIDIGANIGGFALQAIKKTQHVFAVEPIFSDRLRANAELNNVKIHIIDGALGQSGKSQDFIYGGFVKCARTYSFPELKEIAGGCDFLKCDCEGGEWYIKPEELYGIRRIEMELHRIGPTHQQGFRLLMEYLNQHYRISFNDLSSKNPDLYGIVHAEIAP